MFFSLPQLYKWVTHLLAEAILFTSPYTNCFIY